MSKKRRLDTYGRDVTDLYGLHDETDVMQPYYKLSGVSRAAREVYEMIVENKLAVGGCVEKLKDAIEGEFETPLSDAWVSRIEKPKEEGWYWTFGHGLLFRVMWYSFKEGWAHCDFFYWYPEQVKR